jgi:hypothetical protein
MLYSEPIQEMWLIHKLKVHIRVCEPFMEHLNTSSGASLDQLRNHTLWYGDQRGTAHLDSIHFETVEGHKRIEQWS